MQPETIEGREIPHELHMGIGQAILNARRAKGAGFPLFRSEVRL
jgi:hypothetical protein